MFHICKSKSKTKPFSVVLVADNGEVLSQHSLKTKQACFNNIMAQVSLVKGGDVFTYVQDDAHKRPLIFKVFNDQYQVDEMKPSTPYIPGKNPSLKKKKK